MPDYLYRGVCEKMYVADAGTVRPRQQGPFESGFNLDDGHYLDEGLTFDSSVNNSVIKHQKDSRRYPTSGISTTPLFECARHYALTDGSESKGYVFKIDRSRLAAHGVQEFVVADYAAARIAPAEMEVILVCENGGALPTEVIADVVEVRA
jgi:hypothetical protein